MRPLIAVTMGDPAGVGPELCVRILQDRRVSRAGVPVIFGDAVVLAQAASACRLPFAATILSIEEWRESGRDWVRRPAVVDCGILKTRPAPGRVNAACGRAAYGYLREAVHAAMAGDVAAIATAPIHKEALHRAGIREPGHTEILARLTRARRHCMMMACDDMAVSLATIHVPYAAVPGLLTRRQIRNVIELTADAMKRLGRRAPRLVVCALNPHAGEGGLFGDEERRVIAPAVAAARRAGVHVEGPLPPDTAFLPDRRRRTDAFVVMYHDQGLIPFKMLAFDRGVNITLGLPIVRTSVDHGTAFDIAWQGKASPESLAQAVLWAVRLSRG